MADGHFPKLKTKITGPAKKSQKKFLSSVFLIRFWSNEQDELVTLPQYPPNLTASGAVTQKPRRTNFSLQWRLRQGPPQKETPNLVRNTGRSWEACCLTLASKLGGPPPRGIFLCNGHSPFVPH